MKQIDPVKNWSSYKLIWLQIDPGTNWSGHKLIRVQIDPVTNWSGYQLIWVQIVPVTNWSGYKLIRLQIDPVTNWSGYKLEVFFSNSFQFFSLKKELWLKTCLILIFRQIFLSFTWVRRIKLVFAFNLSIC